LHTNPKANGCRFWGYASLPYAFNRAIDKLDRGQIPHAAADSWTMRGSGGGIAYAPPQPLTRLAKRRKDLFMATILPFLRTGENVFDPKDLTAMSTALEDVCEILKLNGDSSARQTVAVRIIDLANAGERTANRLRDRVLHEA